MKQIQWRSILLVLFVTAQSALFAQTAKIDLTLNKAPLSQFIIEVEKQTDFTFMLDNTVDQTTPVTVSAKQQSLNTVLSHALSSTKLTYEILGKQIVLKMKSSAPIAVNKKVSGTVTDEKGETIIGANISVKGTTLGTISDFDGKYSFDTPSSGTLVISYVGYAPQEVTLGSKSIYDVVLKENTKALDEVMVVAYGTQKVKSVTGAMVKMKADEVADIPVPNVAQRMQGKFAGVQISQANGEPNAGMAIRIRGQASINGNNNPLVVVDGFPVSRGLESFNPNEIENITILKDAASAALYGSRAANGVILVTTKGGKVGKTEVELTAYLGVQSVASKGMPDVMNAREFNQFMNDLYVDKARYEGYTGGIPKEYANPAGVTQGTDWMKVLLRDALTQDYNLSLTSGTDKIRSSVTVGYSKQEGVLINQYADRFSARANNEFKASERVTFGLNLSGSYQTQNLANSIGGGRNIIGSSYLMDPQLKYKNDDGTYPISYNQPGMFANANYYLVLRDRKNYKRTMTGTINTYMDVKIIEGLKYRLSANADLARGIKEEFTPSHVQGGMFSAPPNPATGQYKTDAYANWLVENTLTYDKTFAKDHSIGLLAGYTAQRWDSEDAVINASRYPDDEIPFFSVATDKVGKSDDGIKKSAMISYLGRVNYDYKGKYLFSFSYRMDGCSRFGMDGKYAGFPSVSAGWIASDEEFIKKFDKLSYLKLRASWGKVGNNNIGDFTALSTVAGGNDYNYVINGSTVPGRAPNRIGNGGLTWETTQSFDIGVDFGFFNDRLFVMYDYYNKTTNGLLYQIDLPNQAGFGSIQSNIGEFKFWGHEVNIESKNFVKGDFQWSTSLNMTFPRNKAVKLGTNNVHIGGNANQGDENRTMVGYPLARFWGYVTDGVFMTEAEYQAGPKHASSMIGTVRMKDFTGDNEITMDDRVCIGDPNPDIIYGITNTFKWKNFDASVVFSGTIGNDIMDRTYEWTENLDGVFNVRKEVANRWRSPEQPGDGNIPRTRSGTTELFRYNNDRWVFDGSYIMLKNLSIGYTIPMKANKFMKGLRVYASGQNLFWFSGYPGMNPEVSRNQSGVKDGYGVDETAFPIARVFSLGLNLKF